MPGEQRSICLLISNAWDRALRIIRKFCLCITFWCWFLYSLWFPCFYSGPLKKARAGIQEVHFLPFNPTDKWTSLTYIDGQGKMHRVSKGAPEQVQFSFTICLGVSRVLCPFFMILHLIRSSDSESRAQQVRNRTQSSCCDR